MEFMASPDGYRALSTGELRELLQSDDKMEQIIRLNEKFQELQVDREMMLAANRSLAEDSLAQQPRLDNGRLQLAEKYRELSNLATMCWEKQSQLGTRVQKHTLQSAQNLLQEEVERAEENSEELLDKFMEGNVSLEDFLDSFHSSRRTYHIRRAQVEKMQDLSKRHAGKVGGDGKDTIGKVPEEGKADSERHTDPSRPNGYLAQGPLRVFQVRYGLTPAILLPHYPISPSASGPAHQARTPPPEPHPQGHVLGPSAPLHPVGLRVIGQLPGGWPANGRPVRLQQLYRPNPQQPQPPFR
ncbi:vacuolar protein sorting-associated protein 37B [Syngnathoides biaculeatus]|uniref:vacuolar protein sorting-associated protein 37B n=1 Tax=Syngnathoides biaculeatus TaxID=300417 RepID=UPI002ADE4036|nr:vacuolar protein sorting-associated protein 37B [Syngnathoides biaculeatus]